MKNLLAVVVFILAMIAISLIAWYLSGGRYQEMPERYVPDEALERSFDRTETSTQGFDPPR